MSYDISLSPCEGKSVGAIKGASTRANRADCWDVIYLSFGSAHPKHHKTGKASGEAVMKQVRCIIPVDHATPQWFQAACEQDTIKELRFAMHTISDDGQHVEKFIVTLTSAQIADFKVSTGTGIGDDDATSQTTNLNQIEEVLELQFVFDGISVENVHGQSTAFATSWTGGHG
ncbi:MAG: type VI secretion system tube protein Hcp [Polyangiaceae bacterium]